MTHHRLLLATATIAALLAAGCEGPAGPAGPGGPAGADGENGTDGKDGTDGADGKDGTDATGATFVGSASCKTCHPQEHKWWSYHGHGHALVKVSGAKPANPPYASFPAQPPKAGGKSYTWAEITYVVGGFARKALFVDKDGHVINGATAQYNLATTQWGPHQVATTPEKMNCARCHSTGYRASGSQGGLKGIVGTWQEEDIGCERCHGAGSRHVAAKGYEPLRVDRSPTLCGGCHGIEPHGTIVADKGLILHTQQWNELFSTKMKIVACVDCHNPHQSASFDDYSIGNDHKSIVTACESCHFKNTITGKVAKHTAALGGPSSCVTCHMPRAVKSATGNAATFTGDMRSHIFRPNPDPTAPQFSSDGKSVKPYLTLDFVCRQCHTASDKTDAQLKTYATGYHSN